jgi:ABC-2 type transport system permease protein
MNISLLTMSVKKELWEFNKLLLWVPIIILTMMVAAPLLQLMIIEDYQWNGLLNFLTQLQHRSLDEGLAQFSFAAIQGLFIPFMVVALIIQLYYFLVCLFDERRDMSIYFWRSMPISDAATIGTKLFTGAFVIPGIFMLAATVTLLIAILLAAVFCLVLSSGYDISLWHIWGSFDIFSNISLIWLSLFPFVLWLFPLFAWLMLMSMFANKAPFLWALLPIIMLVLVEAFIVHYFNFNSSFFIQALTDYFGINDNTLRDNFTHESAMHLMPMKVLMSKVSVIAVAVGAGLMYLTYWLRVNRSHL